MDAYKFALDIERRIEALPSEEYIRRNTAESKRLIEELLPISKLGMALQQPGLRIDVEAFEDDGEADGLITESGFRDRTLPIQVTHYYSYEESLRDEELVKKGASFGAGPISRSKATGEIESSAGVLDSDAHIRELREQIIALFERKCKKNYATNMVLVISFYSFRLSGLHQWCALLSELERARPLSSESFVNTYLYNMSSNEIQRVS